MRVCSVIALASLLTVPAWAGEGESADWGDAADWGAAADWGDASVEAPKVHEVRIYGFIDSYWEYVAAAPEGVSKDGQTEKGGAGHEFDVANLNVMIQGSVHSRYRYFVNLAAPGAGGVTGDEPISIRNAWVEAPIKGRYLQVRAGKTYRRFGLYNEQLDAVPTFIGIGPPELFDKDHLMVTRTTNLMLHGSVPVKSATVHYSVATGNDERSGSAVPIGADLYVDVNGTLKGGSSFYTSGGAAGPSRAVGEGSPRGGVANWMAEDRYQVFGGYAQLTAGSTTVQTEFWHAPHDAVRDEASVAQLADAGLNARQLERFFVDGDPSKGVGPLAVQYAVQTAYVRAGHQVAMGKQGSITPYIQADWYHNPELVEAKSYGGDGEAGMADDGTFFKYTAGTVIRPFPEVALKLDGSVHQLTYNGATEFYPEVRVSFSYLWQLDI